MNKSQTLAVCVHVRTGYNLEEGNRRASRNERPREGIHLPPIVRFATWFIAVHRIPLRCWSSGPPWVWR
jgi:hypothetical protein